MWGRWKSADWKDRTYKIKVPNRKHWASLSSFQSNIPSAAKHKRVWNLKTMDGGPFISASLAAGLKCHHSDTANISFVTRRCHLIWQHPVGPGSQTGRGPASLPSTSWLWAERWRTPPPSHGSKNSMQPSHRKGQSPLMNLRELRGTRACRSVTLLSQFSAKTIWVSARSTAQWVNHLGRRKARRGLSLLRALSENIFWLGRCWCQGRPAPICVWTAETLIWFYWLFFFIIFAAFGNTHMHTRANANVATFNYSCSCCLCWHMWFMIMVHVLCKGEPQDTVSAIIPQVHPCVCELKNNK